MRSAKIISVIIGITFPVLLCSQEKNFLSFDVEPRMGQVVFIQWTVSSMNDTLFFEVQRRRDSLGWETISHISQTSTGSVQLFSFTDQIPGDGLIYYRIKQIGGRITSYSSIKWVQISKTGSLYIWPNPASDVLHVRTPFADGSMEIVDSEGKLMKKITITDFTTDVSIQQLAKGIYIIRVKHKKDAVAEKFIKT